MRLYVSRRVAAKAVSSSLSIWRVSNSWARLSDAPAQPTQPNLRLAYFGQFEYTMDTRRMWEEYWKSRLMSRITVAGYSSVTDLLQKKPGVTLAGLAKEFECAELQLSTLYLAERHEADRLGEGVRDLLYRKILHRFPGGWSCDHELDWALIVAEMKLVLRRTPNAEFSIPAFDRVWSELRSLDLEGWLPEGVQDSRLEAAFQRGWSPELHPG